MSNQEILISEMHTVIRTAAYSQVPTQYLADREDSAEIEVMFSGLPRETKVIGRFIISIDDYEKLDDKRHLFDIDIDLYDYVHRDNPENTLDDVFKAIGEKWEALIGGKRQW